MDRIDLHAHSTASDGTLSPTELAKLGKSIGLRAMALTDHDTADGLDEYLAACEEIGLEGVPAMETTMVVEGRDVHLVCLYFDYKTPEMKVWLEDLAASRTERNEGMVKKLMDAGFNISLDDFKDVEGAMTRGHIGRVLVQRGYADHPQKAVKQFLSKGTVGHVQRRTPDPASFIKSIHKAGGLCFVAHLHQINPTDPEHCVAVARKMFEAGADGLETRYCEYNDTWRAKTEALAEEYGLLRSGGSDFHGGIKPGLNLGVGYGDLVVPYSYLEAIKAKLGR